MAQSKDTVGTIANLLAIVGAIVAAVWFAADLEGRVRRLEDQVHVLTVAPTIANSSAERGPPISNPMAQACADLAQKAVAGAGLTGTVSEQREAEKMLEQLGCVKRPVSVR